jgi:hypothetical protein
VALVLLLVCSFALGYSFGGEAGAVVVANGPGLLNDVPGEDLVDLLARVEAAADRRGEVERLTFPDSLRGVEVAGSEAPAAWVVATAVEPPAVEQAPPQAPHESSTFSVLVARVAQPTEADELRVKLEAAGLGPVHTSRVAGVVAVAYGSYESEAEAEETFVQLGLLELSSNPVVISQ